LLSGLSEKYKQVARFMDEEKKTPVDDQKPSDENAKENVSSSAGMFKKLAIPLILIPASLIVAALIFVFFFYSKKHEPPAVSEELTTVSQTDVSQPAHIATASSPDTKDKAIRPISHPGDSQKIGYESEAIEFDIDTAEIMKQLEFLFINPLENNSPAGLTPQDSADTLGWIQKEMVKLERKRSEVDKRLEELQGLQSKIDKSLAEIKEIESARITNLARLYDGMKAEEVAKVFANLEDDVVVSILLNLKPAVASKILGIMPPKRAAKLSTQMISLLEE
jgi:flagellar motility protein MotE (MotC chaperone)